MISHRIIVSNEEETIIWLIHIFKRKNSKIVFSRNMDKVQELTFCNSCRISKGGHQLFQKFLSDACLFLIQVACFLSLSHDYIFVLGAKLIHLNSILVFWISTRKSVVQVLTCLILTVMGHSFYYVVTKNEISSMFNVIFMAFKVRTVFQCF